MTKIIADCCNNHLGNMDIIEHMIDKAKEIGIDIIKFQAFNAKSLNPAWENYEKSYLYYKKHELSNEMIIKIINKCGQVGIEPLFTAFNRERAKFLMEICCDKVKIASPDANNWQLIKECLEWFDHVFISTGMHTDQQIKGLREFIKNNKATDKVSLFYCVSKYPTEYEDIDFDKMYYFDGLSDHTMDLRACIKALDSDTGYIERHYTLSKDLPGKDHLISSTPSEFKKLVDYRNYIEKSKQYKTRWINE